MNYQTAQKKHALPPLEELEKAIDGKYEDDAHPSSALIKKSIERIDIFCKLIDGILHPDTNLATLQETECFTQEEKDAIFTVYKKLMFLKRRAMAVSLEMSEDEQWEYLVLFYREWQSLKQELKSMLDAMSNAWHTNNTRKKDDVQYFG
ncbi:hypothetical protein C4573_00110 [Candidatus Woesearchaeota archaeon]|nr:MAG: hypothetical protein C4573_00110 [Candidatus Woesearchaeota archaeon]